LILMDPPNFAGISLCEQDIIRVLQPIQVL
jgi:hypothetical protein